MASGADGSIIIDTQLDNTGFQRGSKQMQNAVNSLNNSVNQTGQNMRSAVQSMNSALQNMGVAAQTVGSKFSQYLGAGQFDKVLGELSHSVTSLASNLSKIGKAEEVGVKPGEQYERLTEKIRQAEQELEVLRSQMEQVAGKTFETDAFKELNDEITKLEERMQKLNIRKAIEDEAGSAKQGDILKSMDADVAKAKAQMDQAAHKVKVYEMTHRVRDTPTGTGVYSHLLNALDQAKEKYQAVLKMRAQMEEKGAWEQTKGYQMLLAELEEVEKKYGQLIRIRDEMLANGSATTGANSSEYQQLVDMYNQLTEALGVYQEEATRLGEAADPANQSADAVGNLNQKLEQTETDAPSASGALSGFGSVLRNIGSAALHAVGSMARLTFKGVTSGAKAAASGIGRFVSSLKDLRKHSGQSALTNNGLVKSLLSVKRMLLTRIKRTFISALFNSLKNGIHSFAKYSSAFNAAMSGMKNSMTGMSGNIAVFAGNLINAIAPAISTIIDWISKAISYLNAFFALLSGKSTYTVAKKGTDDYAKSLKSAGGAAQNLKNQVYGFDELNKEDDNSGGGGSGAGSVDFAEESIDKLPSSLRDIMNSIKEAFAAEQFEEVGAIAARGLNGIITTIDDWVNNKFRPFATTWARNIARILNGFIATFDWANLGKLIADGFNAIVDTVNNFLTTFDFDALAKSFGNGINGLFKNVDWNMLGQTIGKGLQGIWTIIFGTLSNFNWTQLGSSLATGVNSLFSSIDWKKAATQLSDSLKGIIAGINQFLLETDWQKIGDDIATFIGSIDWNGLCDALMNGIGIALVSIGELIWGLIKPAWESVVTWWNETMSQNGGDVIKTLLEGIVTALKNIGQWCLDHIIKPILNGIESALGLEEGTILTVATNLWTMFKTNIETAWNTISTAVGDFFKGVWDAIVGFFGTLGETGKQIWDGFSEGVSAKWEEIKSTVSGVFSGAWNAIIGFFGTLGETGKAIWTGFSEGVSAKWEEIKGAVTDVVKGAWDGIKGAFGKLSEIASNIWEGFSGALSTAWTNFSGPITKVFTDAWDTIKGVFTGIGDVATQIWEGLKKGLSDGWEKLKEFLLQPFKDMWQAVKDFFGIASPSTEAASIGDFILQGLVDGFEAAVTGVCETVKRIFGRIWDAIKSIFGFGSESEESKEAKQAGKDIMTGMKDGIKGDEENVKKEIANAGKVALQALRSEVGIPDNGGSSTKTKTYGESLVNGISDGIIFKATEETFKNAGNKAWDAVKNALNTAFGTRENGSATKTKYVGETTIQGVNDGIDSKAKEGTFKTVAESTIKAVKSALNRAFGMETDTSSASKTKGSGEGVIKGISDGIKEKAVESSFTSVANSVYDAIGKAFNTALGISGGGWFSSASSSKFKDVGKAICQGVADGIDQNTSIIKSAAEQAAQAALTAAKNKLGIKSPSKAFAEIGGYMMQGMSNGLKNGQGEVAKTVSSIAQSLTDGMGNTTFDVGADAMVSGLDRVADKFMTFVDQLNAAANALVDGMLQQPSIATGAYIPPRTRIGETAGTGIDGFASEMRRQEAGRDELFYMIRDEIREGFTALLRKDNSIDGASLERTLASLKRDRERAFGGAY